MTILTTKRIYPISFDKELPQWSNLVSVYLPYVTVYEVSFDPASINANTVSRQDITVTGVQTNDIIFLNPPGLTSGLELISYRVKAADTVEVTLWNSTGGAINEGSGTYKIIAIRN